MLVAMCPACPPAIAARDLVFSETFWTTAAMAVLPFVITGLVVQQLVKRLDRGGSREDR
jgi:hypothetical protein